MYFVLNCNFEGYKIPYHIKIQSFFTLLHNYRNKHSPEIVHCVISAIELFGNCQQEWSQKARFADQKSLETLPLKPKLAQNLPWQGTPYDRPLLCLQAVIACLFPPPPLPLPPPHGTGRHIMADFSGLQCTVRHLITFNFRSLIGP